MSNFVKAETGNMIANIVKTESASDSENGMQMTDLERQCQIVYEAMSSCPVPSIPEENKQSALFLAERGICVFPCTNTSEISKTPLTQHGFKDASCDVKQVQEWWDLYPTALVGIAVPKGVCVLDLDIGHAEGVNGIEEYWKLTEDNPEARESLTTETGSGGLHIWYKNSNNINIKQRDGVFPGGDTRVAGKGYVIEFSCLYDGRKYSLNKNNEISSIPKILESIAISSKEKNTCLSFSDEEYKRNSMNAVTYIHYPVAWFLAIYKEELDKLSNISEGKRNISLNWCAYRLYQIVQCGLVDRGYIDESLWKSCIDNNYISSDGYDSFKKTCNSAWDGALKHPIKILSSSGEKLKNITSFLENDDPLPLRRAMEPQALYPVECFCEYAPAVQALSQYCCVHPSVAGTAVLSYLSLLAQPHFVVKSMLYTTPLSIFGAVIMETGDGKSKVERHAGKEVADWEKDKLKEYTDLMKRYEISMDAYDKELEKLKKRARDLSREDYEKELSDLMMTKPEAPVQPVLTSGDVNVEGMYKAVKDGLPYLGVFSSEGGRLFGGTAFSQENALKTLSNLADVWSGGALDKMRYGDGTSKLFNRRICMSIMIQPIVAEKIFNDPLMLGQGFLCRCLVTWPAGVDQTYENVDIDSLPEMKKFYSACKDLLELEPSKDNNGGLIFTDLALEGEAYEVYKQYGLSIVQLIKKGKKYELVKGYAKRAPEQAIRIAGVLAVARNPSASKVSTECMKAGVEISEWYLDEVLRITLDDMTSPDIRLAESLIEWLSEKEITVTSVRQIQQYGPSQLRYKKVIEATIDILVEHGWLKPVVETVKVWMGDGKPQALTKKAWEVRPGYASFIQE